MATLALAAVGGTLVQTGVAPEERTNITSLVTSSARGPRLQKFPCMGQDPKSQTPLQQHMRRKQTSQAWLKVIQRGPEAAEMHSTKMGRNQGPKSLACQKILPCAITDFRMHTISSSYKTTTVKNDEK